MLWILLLLFMGGSVVVDAYLLAHPPLYKKTPPAAASAASHAATPAPGGTLRILGASLVLLLSFAWIFFVPLFNREGRSTLSLFFGFIWRLIGITPWVFFGVRGILKPLSAKDSTLSPLTFIDLFWRMGGAFLWLFLGLFWVLMPLFSEAWQKVPIPVALLLVDIGMGVSLLIFLAVLIWSKLFPRDQLIFWVFVDGIFLVLIALGIFIVWLPTFWKHAPPLVMSLFAPSPEIVTARAAFWRHLPTFLLFVLAPPSLAAWLLLWWVPDLIPVNVGEEGSRRKALTLLLGFFTGCPKPSAIIGKGAVRSRIAGSLQGAGPGWLLTEPENIIVLKGHTEIRRIVGPGATFIHQDEIVHSILDLRPQLRTVCIQAITRDGIKVNVTMTLVFQITPGRHAIRLTHPWPYAHDAAWRLIFAAEVNPEGRTPGEAHLSRPWSALPLEVARNVLSQLVVGYTLDELYGVSPDQAAPRQGIAALARQRLTERLAPMGIHIETCTMGAITPVEAEVTRQRLEAWKARWIGQLMTWQGAAQARRFTHFAAIRNQARVDLLSHLIEATNITIQQVGGDVKRNIVAYHLLENLEHIARDPEIQMFLPESAAPALTNLRERLKDTTP